MPIKPEHLDELLAGYEKPEDLLGEDGLFKQLKKALLERALGAELTHHLGYEKGDPAGRGTGNNRNGTYRQDGADRGWIGRDRCAARSQRQLRAADRGQGRDPPGRLRRQDHLAVRPRHDGAGDPGPPARTLCRRRLARPDQPGHRRRARRGARMAEPAARCGLSGGLLRRAAGQDPRRERGQEQGRLPGPGARLRGPQARPGPVDRAERGRQVLAAGHERAQEPRRR